MVFHFFPPRALLPQKVPEKTGQSPDLLNVQDVMCGGEG